MYKEYTSIFHEEVIEEARKSTIEVETFRIKVNEAISKWRKTDTTLKAINKRIPKVEKIIYKTENAIDKYNSKSKMGKKLSNMGTGVNKGVKYTVAFGPLNGYDHIDDWNHLRADYLDMDFVDYKKDYRLSDLKYALKKSKEALVYLKKEKARLEKEETKTKHESFLFDDIELL